MQTIRQSIKFFIKNRATQQYLNSQQYSSITTANPNITHQIRHSTPHEPPPYPHPPRVPFPHHQWRLCVRSTYAVFEMPSAHVMDFNLRKCFWCDKISFMRAQTKREGLLCWIFFFYRTTSIVGPARPGGCCFLMKVFSIKRCTSRFDTLKWRSKFPGQFARYRTATFSIYHIQRASAQRRQKCI